MFRSRERTLLPLASMRFSMCIRLRSRSVGTQADRHRALDGSAALSIPGLSRAEDRSATPAEMAAALEGRSGERLHSPRPEGASYELFKDLLPPLRYVDTAFRHYPVGSGCLAASPKRVGRAMGVGSTCSR